MMPMPPGQHDTTRTDRVGAAAEIVMACTSRHYGPGDHTVNIRIPAIGLA